MVKVIFTVIGTKSRDTTMRRSRKLEFSIRLCRFMLSQEKQSCIRKKNNKTANTSLTVYLSAKRKELKSV